MSYIRWASGEDIVEPSFTTVTINNVLYGVTSEDSKVAFAGVYSPKAYDENDNNILYMGAGDKLYYPSQAMTINSCRAYFRLKGFTAGDPQAGVKDFILILPIPASFSLFFRFRSELSVHIREW